MKTKNLTLTAMNLWLILIPASALPQSESEIHDLILARHTAEIHETSQTLAQRRQRAAQSAQNLPTKTRSTTDPLLQLLQPETPNIYTRFPELQLPPQVTKTRTETDLRSAINEQNHRQILAHAQALQHLTQDPSITTPYQPWIQWARIAQQEGLTKPQMAPTRLIQSDYYDDNRQLVRGLFHLPTCRHANNGVSGQPGPRLDPSQVPDSQRCMQCLPTQAYLLQLAEARERRLQAARRLQYQRDLYREVVREDARRRVDQIYGTDHDSDTEADTQMPQRNPADRIVYVSPTGKRYHTPDCSHIGTARGITLRSALASGYTPCQSCQP